MSSNSSPSCPMCGSEKLEPAFHYDAPPPGETPFPLADDERYEREYRRCATCGHFVAVHEFDLARFYEGEYMDSTYAGERLRASFERIMSLPPERSDNLQRVDRIRRFWSGLRGDGAGTLLDVGSGLGVFPARMKEAGWRCTALDPDARSVQHAAQVVGVDAVQGDFSSASDLGRFDLVTFNKVLEHIDDPVAMLAHARGFQADGGIVYVEVPDGEGAAREGPEREEFFVEHVHVFSAASLALLCSRAGFTLDQLERVREPSTKYTLAAFLR
jgi:2-polyprenyl-3-methyl-5-hydroxy-6-metoxy-1,4-benzoquinol methylase